LVRHKDPVYRARITVGRGRREKARGELFSAHEAG